MFLPPVKDASEGGKFSKQRAGAVQVFSGHLKLGNMKYSKGLEDPTSPEFGALADDLEEIVSLFCVPLRYFPTGVVLT